MDGGLEESRCSVNGRDARAPVFFGFAFLGRGEPVEGQVELVVGGGEGGEGGLEVFGETLGGQCPS